MRRSALVAAVVLLAGALASGYALAAASGETSPSAKPIPTITAALPPPFGTPPSSVPEHTAAVPGLGRTSSAFRRGEALLRADRYVGRATDGQRLTFVRADRWTAKDGSPYGVEIVFTVTAPVTGARWLETVSHTDATNTHLTSDPEGDAYTVKWVHLVLERVTRFSALVDFRHRRVAMLLPVTPNVRPPYHLVDPAHLDSNLSATPPG
jgi:hypothetical protein